MSEAVYTKQDLSIMQAWPLERKIQVTQAKIIEWYRHYKQGASLFKTASAKC